MIASDVDTKELKTLDPLHYSPVDDNGCLFGPPFPVVHDQLLCLAHTEGEVVVLATVAIHSRLELQDLICHIPYLQ